MLSFISTIFTFNPIENDGEVLIAPKESRNHVLVRNGHRPLFANKKYLLGKETYNVLPVQLVKIQNKFTELKPTENSFFFNIAGQHLCIQGRSGLNTCFTKGNAKWATIKADDSVYFHFKSMANGQCLTTGPYNPQTDTYAAIIRSCDKSDMQKFKIYKVSSNGDSGIEYIDKNIERMES